MMNKKIKLVGLFLVLAASFTISSSAMEQKGDSSPDSSTAEESSNNTSDSSEHNKLNADKNKNKKISKIKELNKKTILKIDKKLEELNEQHQKQVKEFERYRYKEPELKKEQEKYCNGMHKKDMQNKLPISENAKSNIKDVVNKYIDKKDAYSLMNELDKLKKDLNESCSRLNAKTEVEKKKYQKQIEEALYSSKSPRNSCNSEDSILESMAKNKNYYNIGDSDFNIYNIDGVGSKISYSKIERFLDYYLEYLSNFLNFLEKEGLEYYRAESLEDLVYFIKKWVKKKNKFLEKAYILKSIFQKIDKNQKLIIERINEDENSKGKKTTHIKTRHFRHQKEPQIALKFGKILKLEKLVSEKCNQSSAICDLIVCKQGKYSNLTETINSRLLQMLKNEESGKNLKDIMYKMFFIFKRILDALKQNIENERKFLDDIVKEISGLCKGELIEKIKEKKSENMKKYIGEVCIIREVNEAFKKIIPQLEKGNKDLRNSSIKIELKINEIFRKVKEYDDLTTKYTQSKEEKVKDEIKKLIMQKFFENEVDENKIEEGGKLHNEKNQDFGDFVKVEKLYRETQRDLREALKSIRETCEFGKEELDKIEETNDENNRKCKNYEKVGYKNEVIKAYKTHKKYRKPERKAGVAKFIEAANSFANKPKSYNKPKSCNFRKNKRSKVTNVAEKRGSIRRRYLSTGK